MNRSIATRRGVRAGIVVLSIPVLAAVYGAPSHAAVSGPGPLIAAKAARAPFSQFAAAEKGLGNPTRPAAGVSTAPR